MKKQPAIPCLSRIGQGPILCRLIGWCGAHTIEVPVAMVHVSALALGDVGKGEYGRFLWEG